VTDDLNSANFAADGVLGISWKGNNWWGTPSIVETLYDQGQITNNVLAFKLVFGDPELTIGGLNTDLFSGTPFYTPVTVPGIWGIQFTTFTGGTTTGRGDVAYLRIVCLESTLQFFMLINLNRAILTPSVLLG
jgi:Eukaryotic aspartyl protease